MKKQLIFATLVAMLVMTFPLNIRTAFSQETPVIYVDPPTVVGLSPSQTFTVAVKIANVTDLCGFDVRLIWNPSILEHVSHVAKTPVQAYPGGVLNDPIWLLKDEVNDTAGTYWAAAATHSSPLNGTNGDGTIFEITFRVKAIGRCLLEIASDAPAANSAGELIPCEFQNGFFSNYVPTPADIHVSPDKVIDADLTPCHNFTVNINLNDVVDLEHLEFSLSYNTTILNTTNVAVNPLLPSPSVGISEADGSIQVNASASPPISGDLLLANVTFHVEGTGDSTLDLHNVTLVDSWGDAIPYKEPGDGYFSNVLKAKLFVSPEEIIDPTMTPGTMFSIDIQVDDVFDLYGYSFHLSYNTMVLTCLGAVIVPPNTDPNLVTNISIVDAAGDVAVTVNYFSPAPPITLLTNTTIVTIFFMVESYGCTSLDLHDTLLTNPSGSPIAHDVGDGYFCTLTADVAILWVEPTRNFVYPGRTVDITVIAANLGDRTNTFDVTAYYDNNTISTKTVVNLPPHHNSTLTFTWDTTGLTPCNNYTISAYAHPVMYELNFTNNYFENGWVKIKRIGDINNDGVVDIFDIVLASQAYGTHVGDPKYNAEADVAPQYGVIDLFDMVTIASHYGEGC
jgi:hypothetical protein